MTIQSKEKQVQYAGYRHSTPVQIRFKDTDAMGHINNANHYTYMELARMHYFNDVVAHDHDWTQIGFILAKMVIEYVKPLMPGDTIYVFTRCSRVGTKSFDLEYAIVRMNGGSQDLMATGTSVIVCYNYKQKVSIAVPSEWKEKMQAFEKSR